MHPEEREHFDALLEQVLAELPPRLHELIDEAPVIVDDRATQALLEELDMNETEDLLCGLHSGTPLTERSVSHGHDLPETIHLFREGIIETAGGWKAGEAAVMHEIRVTLLHEIGHHFGLDEEDLEKLGYA
jgi:predicted Zn-dependent protease with MMP-like domain